MSKFCFLNGSILPVSEAKVGVYDIGLLRGFGVYDGMAAFGGKLFRFEDHMRRFRDSATALKLSLPYSDEEIQNVLLELLQKNAQDDAVIRMILTGGETMHGIEFDPGKPTFFILMEDFNPYPESLYSEGGTLITHEYKRYMPQFKTIHYIEAVLMQDERKRREATEVLYIWEGKVLEPSTSNFFAFLGDTLVTPKDDVLGGITRKVVKELAEERYKIEERELSLEEALRADEAFITSSFKGIVPIVKIDEALIGDGRPGKRTAELIERFRAMTRP